MSFLKAMEYIIGIGFFGLGWWLMNGILEEIDSLSETGNIFDLANYMWMGCLLVYLIFGGIWVVRSYVEDQYTRGGN